MSSTELQMELFEQIQKLYSNYKKTSTSRFTASYLETRKELLDEYWQKYADEYREVIKEIDTSKEERKKLKDLYDKTEDLYLEFKTSIKEHLASYTAAPSLSPSAPITQIKLPPINLPTFSGNYHDWLNFKELFVSLIDDEKRLSDIQKHHYLRSSLKGEADQLLRHLDITAANYEKAWKALVNRYSNKRILVNTVLNRLFNQKKLAYECPKGLRELLDTTNECLNNLGNLEVKTENWDPMIVHTVVSKLDPETHKCWEQSLGSTIELPLFSQLTSYLEGRFRAMEMVQTIQKKEKKETSQTNAPKLKSIKTFTGELKTECSYCQKNHYICHCTEFTQLDVEKRREFVKNNGLCFNCLVKGHSIKFCRQDTSCRKCNRRHHTFLHDDTIIAKPILTSESPTPTGESDCDEPDPNLNAITSMKIAMHSNTQVVLATALVGVKDRTGTLIPLRALVDQGSQATFITETTVQLLGLKRSRLEANVTGIGNNSIKARHIVNIDIHSLLNTEYVTQVNAHVLTKLTPLLPSKEIDITNWPGLTQMKLADPHMHSPGPIDLLLGADVYAMILLEGLQRNGSLIAQNSRLGWLLSGTIHSKVDQSSHNLTVSTTLIEVDQLLRKFWETEEYKPNEKPLSLLDKQCEEHYKQTHTRQEDGRYIVRLPFKDNHEENLGDSRQIALNRLHHMEKRFAHKPKYQQDYIQFMTEYQTRNHMEDVKPKEKPSHKVYYLPHHAVVREASTTTKLRVVFDGTAQPSDGSALNQELLVGPALQRDLRDLIIRWRTHKVCLLADVKQMYRQILVSKDDVDYQRILWRPSPLDDVVEKRLLTVTYGTSCAPFLAIRTLKQLAQDEKLNYPETFDVINNDFYMDDLLTGANDENAATNLQKRVTEIMAKGQFEMHKWASNSHVVLQEIPNSHKIAKESVDITMDDTIKALGVRWNSLHDVFELKFDISSQTKPFTKTTVLSDIAKAFDPLGFLGPVIITSKIFLQKLWLCGVGWTDELPLELASEWSSYRDQLLHMDIIYLNRWLHTLSDGTTRLEVHGFSDASCLAYSAAVYLRVITTNTIHVSLVIAKTKVAPVKQVSLPRLELCGAVLLSKLLNDVKTSLKVADESVFAWTDSMIVLSWLRKNPNVWKTYVANRTTEILNVVSSSQWHHIKSADNPADCASRGISPELLKDFDLWWHGPKFLRDTENISCSPTEIPDTNVEIKIPKNKVLTHTSLAGVLDNNEEMLSYLTKYSKLQKLIRVTAYMLKFVKICKSKIEVKKNQFEPISFTQYLTVEELKYSFNVCVRLSQMLSFNHEIQILRRGGRLPRSSQLIPLAPYLDKNDILRVSGRLRNADISFDTKSPIVLSSKCHLALLIVKDAHIQALHGGPQLTLNVVRHKYWIIGAKNLIKRAIGQCVTCFRYTSTPINQLMGQLPPSRVTPGKPFRSSGVDYAGPVMLKLYPGRCKRTCKAYICLFICTVTKAIHLELVSDLSTAAFLASFRRFTSRRGHCSNLWSDCATNFTGASNELDCMFKNRRSQVVGEIAELLANDNTTWHFIPPGSPHFGGLWEAGVKSIKGHLKRVIGQTLMTFEEYATLLTQVESCVNSRPLTRISSSIDDVSPITPGHFLIGEAPIVVPEESLEHISLSRLDRWQLIQRMVQDLWNRWSSEYLTTLQNRYKWSEKRPEPEIGTIVLVKDERLPPGKWLLGRILDKHPGKDGLTRVVTLKFKNNVFKRPITKICPLPMDS